MISIFWPDRKLTDHLFIFEEEGMIKDHYGSYTSYRRAQEVLEKKIKKDLDKVIERRPDSKEKITPGTPKTKLSYKEQQEYNRLETEIEELEQEKADLEAELSAGKLGYESLGLKSMRIAEVIELIEAKLQRWLELGQYVE